MSTSSRGEGEPVHELLLTGLDGGNPLGFLAALGVLEAANADSDVRLAWDYVGAWRPVLTSRYEDLMLLVEKLDADRQECRSDPALALSYDGKHDLKPRPALFREYLERLLADVTPQSRRSIDWASAFATDVAVDNNGNTKPTALHFTAGQQQFLQMVGELVECVTKNDLREAVEGPWQYARPLPVMGWDATASRDYALRASDPSTDKKLGVPGADWLAVRGLTYFPTVPEGNRVLTTACTGGWKDGTFTWSLWTIPLNCIVVRSLLRQKVEQMTNEERVARGIGIAFGSRIRRSDQGGYGSFQPASVI